MNNPYTFGSELSQSQVDQALFKLSALMKGEEKVTIQHNQVWSMFVKNLV